jgi:hypothetical protein
MRIGGGDGCEICEDLKWIHENVDKMQKYRDGYWTLWSGKHFTSDKDIRIAAYWLRKSVEAHK